jgi:hypothetical protein
MKGQRKRLIDFTNVPSFAMAVRKPLASGRQGLLIK